MLCTRNTPLNNNLEKLVRSHNYFDSDDGMTDSKTSPFFFLTCGNPLGDMSDSNRLQLHAVSGIRRGGARYTLTRKTQKPRHTSGHLLLQMAQTCLGTPMFQLLSLSSAPSPKAASARVTVASSIIVFFAIVDACIFGCHWLILNKEKDILANDRRKFTCCHQGPGPLVFFLYYQPLRQTVIATSTFYISWQKIRETELKNMVTGNTLSNGCQSRQVGTCCTSL